MPEPRFRGDPYLVLEVRHDASNTQIKRRWRDLAREHHPDRAAGDRDEAARLTTEMARINAAYDLLRDPVRRAAWDASPQGLRARRESENSRGIRFDDDGTAPENAGPPPPPRTAPVTGRFDMSASLRPRNARMAEAGAHPRAAQRGPLRGQPPLSRTAFQAQRELRASTPTGPVQKRQGKRTEPPPTLAEARETQLGFGRFHGYTLGEVELIEPTYIDWVARTITRDRDLVARARLIQEDMDRRGVIRRTRPAAPGFDSRTAAG